MEERYLLEKLRGGNSEAFSFLFKLYYKDLVLFGGTILLDKVACEDIVQTVFMRLWKDHTTLQIETSLKSYLLKAVRNSCLDEIRHQYSVREHESHMLSKRMLHEIDTEEYILHSDLNTHLSEALQKLPVECRTAFEMNRFECMKYKEIAKQLGVSERTIEVRIGKALKLLKESLKDFFSFLL